MSIHSRPIERYVRCSVEIPGGSVEVGVQRLDFAHPDRETIRRLVHAAWLLVRVGDLGSPLRRLSPEEEFDRLSQQLELDIGRMWPDRGWFVEVWNETEALTQVYAPCGMPRV